MACRQKGMFGSAIRILSLTDQRVNIIKQRMVPPPFGMSVGEERSVGGEKWNRRLVQQLIYFSVNTP